MPPNLIFFLIWITSSFLLTSHLKKKVGLFEKIGIPKNFFWYTILFLVLHKITSDLLNVREITFLFLSAMSFGITLSLMILKKKDSLKKRTEKEMIYIQKISAQSQLSNYKKNRSKK